MQVRAAFVSSGILAAILAATASVAIAQPQQYPDQPAYQAADEAVDPPGRVARISVLRGDVSLEPAGVEQFSQAETNYPLTNGDRVYTDLGSLAELQTAGLSVRLGNAADLTISSLTDQVAQFGLAQGSIRVRTNDLSTPDGTQGSVEIDTPNGAIYVVSPGDLRVDFYPQNGTTVVTVTSGQAQVQGQNLDQTLGPNESMRLVGNPPSAQYLRLLPPDALDRFDQERDQEFQRAIATQDQYVSPDMIGVEDLARYGDWSGDPDYGNVWYPRGVDVDWTPYHNGHWAYIAPWGWTWVESEPWGFAPFHYGRWANFRGRWGWVPGPPTRVFGRPVRPVYSPALVAFVGGPGFSLSIGGGAGLGVTAWFPLGPREPYRPWYQASPRYVNRVNVTNIYNRNQNEVRDNYNNRDRNVYERNDRNQNFQNRGQGTTAVAQRDFSAGHRVDEGQRIRLDDRMRQQVNQAPVMVRPTAAPSPGIRAPQTPAKALPPIMERPRWDGRGGDVRNQPRPGGNPGGNNQPGDNRGGNNQGGNSQPGNNPGNPDRGRQGPPNGNPGQPNGNPGQPSRPADVTRPTEPARVITPATANPPRPTNQPENNQPRNGQPAAAPTSTPTQPANVPPVRNREPVNPPPAQPQPTPPQQLQPQRPTQQQPVPQQQPQPATPPQRPNQQQQQDQQQQIQQQQQQEQRRQQQRQQDQVRPQPQPAAPPDQQQQRLQQEQQRQQQQDQQQRQQQDQRRQQDQQRQQQQTRPQPQPAPASPPPQPAVKTPPKPVTPPQ